MERSILSLCASLSSVLDHADSSSRELADVVSRRPIHLGNHHAHLPSFPYPVDDDRVPAEAGPADGSGERGPRAPRLHDLRCCLLRGAPRPLRRGAQRLRAPRRRHRVEPEVDTEVQDGDIGKLGDPASGCFGVSSSLLRSSKGRFRDDEDPLFGESLKSLGFSDACLATLSSEVTDNGENLKELYKDPESADEGKKIMKEAELIAPQSKRDNQGNSFKEMIRASKEEYEQLPPYMKSLASWEELQEGISKLNSYFGSDEAKGSVSLNQDDVGAIGLGRKGRACLLMLLRLNQLTMEAVDGSTFYTLRKNNS
uniref:Uncharacterized protein n=1 Tax=Setaria italica TaxID=4555 RepID=K3XKB5_SETIT